VFLSSLFFLFLFHFLLFRCFFHFFRREVIYDVVLVQYCSLSHQTRRHHVLLWCDSVMDMVLVIGIGAPQPNQPPTWHSLHTSSVDDSCLRSNVREKNIVVSYYPLYFSVPHFTASHHPTGARLYRRDHKSKGQCHVPSELQGCQNRLFRSPGTGGGGRGVRPVPPM
jgi:hypothetical protein